MRATPEPGENVVLKKIMKRKGRDARICTIWSGKLEYSPKQMKGSVRLAESNSIYTQYLASLRLSMQRLRQPNAMPEMVSSSSSVTTDLRARFIDTEKCIRASASSVMVLRQSGSAMRNLHPNHKYNGVQPCLFWSRDVYFTQHRYE